MTPNIMFCDKTISFDIIIMNKLNLKNVPLVISFLDLA